MGEAYDARKSDIWSIGIILYALSLGLEPSANIESSQMISNFHNRRAYVSQRIIDLMRNMLNNNESKRFDSQMVIECDWLAMYYNKYKHEIDQNKEFQLKRNQELNAKMKSFFPYYGAK